MCLLVLCIAGDAAALPSSSLPLLQQTVSGADDTEMADADVLGPQLAHISAERADSQEQKQSSGLASPTELLRNRSQGSRRRIYADPPPQQQQQTVEQQLADAQAALKRMSDEHAAALQQQQAEAEERAATAATSICRVEEHAPQIGRAHV